MKHAFTEMKFRENNSGGINADFSGVANSDQGEEFVNEVLNYNEKKLDLAVDRVPDVTKETISFKETMMMLELHAVQKLHRRKLINIQGAENIYERPMLTKSNYMDSQSYQEWRKLIDATKHF